MTQRELELRETILNGFTALQELMKNPLAVARLLDSPDFNPHYEHPGWQAYKKLSTGKLCSVKK